jgi:hypothetical protein
MVKKIVLISVISIVIIISGGFLYFKYGVLKTNDVKPDNSKASSVLDLRPAIIAKLQQLVKEGSDGLYTLSIKKIDPDLLSSKLDVVDGSLLLIQLPCIALMNQKNYRMIFSISIFILFVLMVLASMTAE